MSRICVEATLELATETDAPLMLIASRRQIDCEAHGGGYVENWTTEQWAGFVRGLDPQGRVLLCRDHGGPWQGNNEAGYDAASAMQRAKTSYTADIASGLQVIHIDPSLSPQGQPPLETVLERLYELYEHCWSEAQRLGKDIVFEVGTEEQDCATGDVEGLGEVLGKITGFCRANKLPLPQFVVAQTGTKVMETQNIGVLGQIGRHSAAAQTLDAKLAGERALVKLVEQLTRHEVWLKQHNTDYLDDETLRQVPQVGVHAANVAPEFGVAETKAFLQACRDNGLDDVYDQFIELSFNTRKWEKWMLPHTTASDYDRAVIGGHYVFAKPEGRELRAKAVRDLAAKGVDLNSFLKQSVKASIRRYMVDFNLCQQTQPGQKTVAA
jgi:tagatose-1,6-bisphosphate aldolase non-catalytic subunit AgaZ/GatZ